MDRLHATLTDMQQGAALTYAEVMRDPRLMERLVREAHRARSEAIYRTFAAGFDMLWSGVLRVARTGRALALSARREVNAALAHQEPPARRC